jgi:16S rRNA (cytosine1402-N4)-methyltransferase
LATLLLDMPSAHVPVLAGEAIDLLAPRPGEVAVDCTFDCTFGGGGHARLLADRIGPQGTLVAVDRDPVAVQRFAAFAQEAPSRTRFVRASFVKAPSRWPIA